MKAMTKYNIIPKPNHYTCGNSEYVVSSGTAVLCPEEFVGVGKYLTEYLKTKPVENEGEIKIKKTPELSHDEYELHITNEGIIIKASTYSGAFYGAVTLKMILMQAEKRDGKAIVKTLIIKDKPENEYRGLMLDVSRHYFTVDEIKDLIENMAFLKLNKFHWHLSDDQGFRIESKLYPELTEIGAKRTSKHLKGYGLENDNVEETRYYTQEEVKDIVAFADRLGVEVIPEIYKLFEFDHEERTGFIKCKGVKYKESFFSFYSSASEREKSEKNYAICNPHINPNQFNNYHPIPANEKINKGLHTLLAGDIVYLEGYLVDVPSMGMLTGTRTNQHHEYVMGGQNPGMCFILFTTKLTVNGYTYQ